MRCNRFRKQLIPYVEGSLSEPDMKLVGEHISTCKNCARELDDIARTVDVLRQAEYPPMEPASDLRSRVMAQVVREPAQKSRWAGRLPAYSAAAAALMLFAVVLATVENPFARFKEPTATHQPAAEVFRHSEDADALREELSPDAPVPIKDSPVEEIASPQERAISVSPPESPVLGEPFEEAVTVRGRVEAPGSLGKDLTFGLEAEDSEKVRIADTRPGYEMGLADHLFQPTETGRAAAASPPTTMPYSAADTGPTVQSPPGGGQQSPQATDFLRRDEFLGQGNIGILHGDLPGPKLTGFGEENLDKLEKKAKEFPSSRTAMEELMRGYRESGRAQDEYLVAVRLTRLEPGNPKYWVARAQAAERANMPKTAIASYRRAIKLELTGADLELAEARLKALESETSK